MKVHQCAMWLAGVALVGVALSISLVQATGSSAMDGECEVSHVPVAKNSKYEYTADGKSWGGPKNCTVRMKANDPSDVIHLVFTKFDLKDCNVKLVVAWGEKLDKGKRSFGCSNIPELMTDFKDESVLTLKLVNIEKDSSFSIAYEVSTNLTLTSALTNHAIVNRPVSVSMAAAVVTLMLVQFTVILQ